MITKVPHRLYLTEDQIPQQWYNLRADMKEQPAPMINPATGKPAELEDLYPVFCKELAAQEMDGKTRYFDIPDEVMDIYKIYRPAHRRPTGLKREGRYWPKTPKTAEASDAPFPRRWREPLQVMVTNTCWGLSSTRWCCISP